MRGNTSGTCVHEHKIARAEGVLRHTYFITCLSKGSGLLVTGIGILISHPRLYWGETGGVDTPSLVIEEGAIFQGNCVMGDRKGASVTNIAAKA